MSDITLSPPPKPLSPRKTEGKIEAVVEYLKNDLFNYFTQLYTFLYYIWLRTGGYNSNIPAKSNSLESKGNTIANADSNLLEYTLKANTINGDGQYIAIDGFGTFVANADNKQLKLYFGSSLLFDSTSLSLNSGSWNVKATVLRANSSSQKAIVTIISSNNSLPAKSYYSSISQNLSADVLVKFVANAQSINDVIQEGLLIQIG